MQNNLVLEELEKRIKGKTIVLGIGNTLRADDGFGSLLAQSLKDRLTLKIWDAGSAPENFLGSIIKEKPDQVLFIDAVDFSGAPAELRIFDSEIIKNKNFFLTHNPAPDFLFDFLKKNTQAEFYLLAVQPESIGLTEKMSQKMQERLEDLRLWFLDKYGKDNR